MMSRKKSHQEDEPKPGAPKDSDGGLRVLAWYARGRRPADRSGTDRDGIRHVLRSFILRENFSVKEAEDFASVFLAFDRSERKRLLQKAVRVPPDVLDLILDSVLRQKRVFSGGPHPEAAPLRSEWLEELEYMKQPGRGDRKWAPFLKAALKRSGATRAEVRDHLRSFRLSKCLR
jgi:hypothetical protein